MRLFAFALSVIFSFTAWGSTTYTTQISGIDAGLNEEGLIFLSNGRVAKLHSHDVEKLNRLHRARQEGSWLSVTVDEGRKILAVDSASPLIRSLPSDEEKENVVYTPSIIPSAAAAHELFKEARVKHKDSQCFNRAQVWTYEWRAKHGLYTSKMWLFFTRKYIRKYDFEWWFHVAPYLNVEDAGRVWLRVADAKYARTPLKLKQWTDIFLRNDANCPVVSSYSEYANYPESGWCYLMKSSMYYYQPLDLEKLDKFGIERHVWNPTEIQQAYKEAFDLDVQ